MQAMLHRGVRAVTALCLLAPCAPVSAAPPVEESYDLSPVDTSPAGDRFFAAPDAAVSGHRVFAAKLTGTYGYAPLLIRVEDDGTQHEIVASRLSMNVGASFALARRFLLFADLPVIVYQGGSEALRPDSPALADARLGARLKLASAGPVDFASDLRVWLPTGSGDALAGDGTPRASLSGVASGKVSLFSFAASLGFLARERTELGEAELGPAFPFALAAAVSPTKNLQLGPELWGAPVAGGKNGFLSDRETPLFALFGLRFRAGSWLFGGAAGPGLTHTPGVSPRIILNFAYEPVSKRVRNLRDEPAAVPPERPIPAPAIAPPQQVEEVYPEPNAASPSAAAAAAAPAPSASERSEAEIRAEAREAFTRGVTAYDEARYPDAVAEFSRAYQLLPHLSVLRNLAHSELMSGKLDEACAHFVRWRDEVKDPSPGDMKQAMEGMARACP
jgi:hypothetical protein